MNCSKGMLVCKRTRHVLKPATKAIIGEREIAFYENLTKSRDPTIAQLKQFVPHYYGTTELRVFNKRTKFLTLKDITEGMAEPCVMDIKIGRRTWDPLATPEKRATEEFKYAESKRAYGFCITGFQVYCLSTGRLKKFDRDYGKKLDAMGVVEAMKTFLNITPERPASQRLIVELLSVLGRIILFFRMQRKYRFYSSSLLVAYDAQPLRQQCRLNNENSSDPMESSRTGSASSPSASLEESNADISEEQNSEATLEAHRPMLKRSVSLNKGLVSIAHEEVSDQSGSSNPPQVEQICRSCPSQFSLAHADANNVNDAMTNNRDAPTDEKDDNCSWVRVNMIDFTHVFPAEDDTGLDLNYLEGIENLIKLLKTFLKRARERDSE
ncbi:inositol polyphosphate multikinase isoform X2 [Linepithema humile]|uniref:inositol polyphosphate multikinase isoform X2 n=1 Tax=Linepithema humile TaxID=83485 RepID=UPI00351ECB64